jgi:hypothetical protein
MKRLLSSKVQKMALLCRNYYVDNFPCVLGIIKMHNTSFFQFNRFLITCLATNIGKVSASLVVTLLFLTNMYHSITTRKIIQKIFTHESMLYILVRIN